MQYVPQMIELGIDMWTPQFRCNDLDFLYDTYGDRMGFTIPLQIPAEAGEDEIRRLCDDFVDRYGGTGRTFCWPMCPPDKTEIVYDEIYRYSLQHYNKLYGRE